MLQFLCPAEHLTDQRDETWIILLGKFRHIYVILMYRNRRVTRNRRRLPRNHLVISPSVQVTWTMER